MLKFTLALTALIATPAMAEPITFEKVSEYIAVCRSLPEGAKSRDLTTIYIRRWGNLDDALNNSAICLAFQMGKMEATLRP